MISAQASWGKGIFKPSFFKWSNVQVDMQTKFRCCRSIATANELPKDYWALSVLDPEHLVGFVLASPAPGCLRQDHETSASISYWLSNASFAFKH